MVLSADLKENVDKRIRNFETIVLSKEELLFYLPHRRNAMKIDGVVYVPSEPEFITGIKRLEPDDIDLDGHFDGKPVYPGHCIIECANLAAAMLILITSTEVTGYPTVTQIKNIEYQRPFSPGETLSIRVFLCDQQKVRGRVVFAFKFEATKEVDGRQKAVAHGEIVGTAT